MHCPRVKIAWARGYIEDRSFSNLIQKARKDFCIGTRGLWITN